MTQFYSEIAVCVARHNDKPRMDRALSLFIAAIALLDYEAAGEVSEDDFAAAARIAHQLIRKALRSGLES